MTELISSKDEAYENPAAVLDATYPLAFLESSERGLAVVSGTLARVGADSEAFSALRVGWSGSLAELLDVAEEFRASLSASRLVRPPRPALRTSR